MIWVELAGEEKRETPEYQLCIDLHFSAGQREGMTEKVTYQTY